MYVGWKFAKTLVNRKADIIVDNTGNTNSIIRVVGDSYWTYSNYNLWNLINPVNPLLLSDFYAMPLSSSFVTDEVADGGTTVGNLNYIGFYRDPVNLFNPHVMNFEVYSGPFLVASHQEYYYPVSKFLSWELYLTGASKMSESTPLHASSKAGALTLGSWAELTTQPESEHELNLNANNSQYSFLYNVSHNVSSIIIQMFYPPGADISLHAYDQEGLHIGYNEDVGDISIEFAGSYTGKDSNPELINILDATNNTYNITAILAADSSLEYPTNIHVLEIPFRPAILGVVPEQVYERAIIGENMSFYLIVGESGQQHPLYNVSVNLTEISNGSIPISQTYYNLSIIAAGTSKYISVNITVPENLTIGNYTGQITIDSADTEPLITNVTIAVLAYRNATIELSLNQSYVNPGEQVLVRANITHLNGTPIKGTVVSFDLSDYELATLPEYEVFTDSQGIAELVLNTSSTGAISISAADLVGNMDYVNLSIGIAKFELDLFDGWNLISFPLNISNKTISNIFNNINYNNIYTYENNSYIFLDNNSEIDLKKGYWVNVNDDYNLTINGTLINNLNYNLINGYNSISYPSINENNVNYVFDNVNSSIINILTYDNKNKKWQSYSYNKNLNSITNIIPGNAYFIETNQSVNWSLVN